MRASGFDVGTVTLATGRLVAGGHQIPPERALSWLTNRAQVRTFGISLVTRLSMIVASAC